MRKFTDRSGREWAIALTLGSIKRIKGDTGVDLLDLLSADRFQPMVDSINTDPFLLAEVIYSALKPDISKEQFAEALDGDVMEAATEALLRAITDFSPSQRRGLLAKVLDKLKGLEQKQAAMGLAILDDPKMDAALEEMVSRGLSSTSSPDKSASTPTP